MNESETRLNTYSKEEWWDVYRKFKPDHSWEDFCLVWEAFQTEKEERIRQDKLQ